MKKFDWEIHNVVSNPISFHTHGLDKYNSLEIEIVLPLHLKEGASFCNCIGAAIAEGLKIEDGLMVEGLFNLPIYFFKIKPIHGDKEVFRAIFPDANGFFPWEEENGVKCSEGYIDQIEFTQDKAFFIEINDLEWVEEYKSGFGKLLPNFTIRQEGCICVIQRFLAGPNGGLVKSAPFLAGTHLKYMYELVRNLRGLYGAKDIRVICKHLDYSDLIHKDFKEWKERY